MHDLRFGDRNKFALLGFIFGTLLALFANPLITPSVQISELVFDEQHAWTLELEFFDGSNNTKIDSMYLSGSQGKFMLPASLIPAGTGGMTVLHGSEITPDPGISYDGDSLILGYFFQLDERKDVLIFGKVPGAVISPPRIGQSLARMTRFVFVRDASPTLGKANDTAGACATMRGRVVDAQGRPVELVRFELDFPFVTETDGTYSTRLLARPGRWQQILYHHGPAFSFCQIQTLQYDLAPDTSIDRDIHLLGPLASLLALPEEFSTALLSIFPDPVVQGTAPQYQTALPIRAKRFELSVIDIQGRYVGGQILTQSSGTVDVHSGLRCGVYVALIHANGKSFGAARFLVVRS